MRTEETINLLKNTDKTILYTSGLRYRNPTTLDVPISNNKAIAIINGGNWAHYDIDEYEDCIYFTTYSANDMW